MINILLDTNILLDFLLIEWKIKNKQPIHNDLKKSEIIRKELLNGTINNFTTNWELWEYRDIVEKISEEKKLLLSGYAIHEFSEGRKILPKTTTEIVETNKSMEDIKNISTFTRMEMDESSEKLIYEICRAGFSLLDAIHILNTFLIKDCKYLVTRDNRLRNHFDLRLKHIIGRGIKVINRKELIKLIEKSK